MPVSSAFTVAKGGFTRLAGAADAVARAAIEQLRRDLSSKRADSMSTARLLGRNTAGTGVIEEIALGTNLSFSGTTLNASGGGGVSDGDKGDISVSGGGTVWTVDADAVTYAKIQNVSVTDRLLGRSTAGAGDVEEITCTAAGRALIDDADAATQRTTLALGNVDNTSDASKPVSTATQTALDGKQPLDSDLTTIAGLTATTDNFIVSVASAWASRTPAQAKTTLALSNVDNTSDANKPVSTATQTALDLKHNNSMATNRLLGRNTAGTGVIEEIVLGTNLSFTGTTLNAAGGSGTFSISTTEKDLGSIPRRSGSFTITDAAIAAGEQVIVTQAGGPYTGKGDRNDEAEMDHVTVSASAAAGSAECFWTCESYVAGNFKFNYVTE